MQDSAIYTLLADLILVLHFMIAALVVLGFVAIAVGRLFHWNWIYDRFFRISHLIAIGIIVLQSWLGTICPLTVWEQALRSRAGASAYSESFMQHWLHKLLFFEAELWVFGTIYTVLGMLLLYFWLRDWATIQNNGADSL